MKKSLGVVLMILAFASGLTSCSHTNGTTTTTSATKATTTAQTTTETTTVPGTITLQASVAINNSTINITNNDKFDWNNVHIFILTSTGQTYTVDLPIVKANQDEQVPLANFSSSDGPTLTLTTLNNCSLAITCQLASGDNGFYSRTLSN